MRFRRLTLARVLSRAWGILPGGCDFFLPGDYPTGITASGSNNYVAYFFPGIYYMDSNGFQSGSNGDMAMYPGANADTSAHGTGSGMLVYNTGNSTFKVGSNGGATLVGSDTTSDYKGILLFQDRNSPAHITKNTDDHIIGGGGTLNSYRHDIHQQLAFRGDRVPLPIAAATRRWRERHSYTG